MRKTAKILGIMVMSAVMLAYSVNADAKKEKQTGKPAIVFLVAGQSNAGGCGIMSPEQHEKLGRSKKRPLVPGSTAKEIGLSTAAADYSHTYIRVPEQGFQPIDPEVNLRPISLNIKMHGMELPVVRELEKRFPDNDIYVIKYGPGGKNLFNDWNPDRQDAHYAKWLSFYKDGMAKLSKEYPEARVIGLYWDQGESDKKHADAYEQNLKNFIAKVRQDTGLPKLKFFIRKHIYDFTNIDKIVAAQKNVVKDDPNCFLLDIDLGDPKKNYETWSYSTGNIHLSSKAFVELTKKLFDDVLKDAKVDSFDLYKAQ